MERGLPGKIALAATVGLLVQMGVLAAIERGSLVGLTTSLAIIAPSLLSTASVAVVLRRQLDTFPGKAGWSLALALSSSYLAALLSALILRTVDVHANDFALGTALVSVSGAIVIGLSVYLLVRRFEPAPALAMLGAAGAIGGAAFAMHDETVIVLGTTLVWTPVIGFLAGTWLARALPFRDQPE